MSKKVKRTFIWTIIIGILGSILIGLIAMFVFDVNGEAAAFIIGSGSVLAAVTGATVIGVAKANEKKDDGKK